jgi:hypothetical protein
MGGIYYISAAFTKTSRAYSATVTKRLVSPMTKSNLFFVQRNTYFGRGWRQYKNFLLPRNSQSFAKVLHSKKTIIRTRNDQRKKGASAAVCVVSPPASSATH